MTASLPPEVQQVFDRFLTTEFTTVDHRGQPICWPVGCSYEPGDPCIDVAAAPEANPKVALLFSEPAGSGMEDAPQVLVQGMAAVDEGEVVHVRPERVYVWPGGDATQEPQLFDVDSAAGRVRIAAGVLGVPVQPGLACLTPNDRLQVRGDLVEKESGWVLVPHQTIGRPEKSRDAD